MNKSEFVDAIAEKASLSKADAAKAVDAVMEVVTDTLKGGDQVTLIGFGTFLNRRREARDGRNPRTGETIKIAAAKLAAVTTITGLKILGKICLSMILKSENPRDRAAVT